jgi:hypothetical protein
MAEMPHRFPVGYPAQHGEDSMSGHHWPDEHWSIFSTPNPAPYSATWCSLEWLRGSTFLDAGVLAEQFKRAGDEVVEHRNCNRGYHHPDGLFMPVAYLYRHSLELKLKHLVGLACDAGLATSSTRLRKLLTEEHDLDRLWGHARKAILARWPGSPEEHVIDNTEALIRDFDRIDESGQNLRYTHDKSGAPTSMNYPAGIDLGEFKEAFDGVFSLLEGCSSEFAEIADCRREAEREGP